jgi:DNA mismatch repair protein MSH2
VKTYDLLLSLTTMTEFLEGIDLPKEHVVSWCYTSKIKGMMVEFDRLKEMIEESIDISKVKQGEYIINPEFNDDLKDLNGHVNATFESIKQL